jgi:signal transduction histidine kinase
MNSIYRSLQLQFYFVLVLLLAAGYFTYRFSKEIIAAKTNLHSNTQLLELVHEAKSKPNSNSISLELQKTRAYTKNKERAIIISNFIAAYNSNNRPVIEKRYNELIQFEKAFIAISEDVIQSRSELIFLVVFGAVLLHIINIFVYLRSVQKQMLNPLSHLNQKITDFMSGSYSYRFTTAPDNEIGNLERSFRLMAEEVIKNMEELKALDQAKSEFMNIVSHELRTPMTSIKGSLGLIASGKMGEVPEKMQKLIDIAQIESNRLIRLINDFLDLAKIEAKSYSLQKSWVSIHSVITSSVESLKGLQEKAKVKLEIVQVPAVEVLVDPDKIQQVLVNLLSNAMKFTPEGGSVHIEANTYDGKLFVRVRDQGPGISEENQLKIFQKFRQASTPDRPLVKGTGLGLSIAKSLVEAHDGKIGVASQLGNGSEFYFVLMEYRDIVDVPKETVAA